MFGRILELGGPILKTSYKSNLGIKFSYENRAPGGSQPQILGTLMDTTNTIGYTLYEGQGQRSGSK